MKNIISGKSILLNTVSNCTFIANDLDESIQTGSRENDKHIEWVGELDINACEHQYKDISRILWDILDEIDSASDIIKPVTEIGYKKFYDYAMEQCVKRHLYLKSDGYKLERNISPEPKLN